MGFFDFLTGRKRPAAGVAAQSPDAVRTALLALDRPTAPYTVRAARVDEVCDVVAEWRIVDARWYAVFARNALQKSFTVFMHLDAATTTVRALERRATLQWGLGWPNPHLEGEVTWGHSIEKSFGTGFGFTEELRPGVVYNYRFDSSEIVNPLQQTVTAMGWTWQAVGLGEL